MTFAMHQQAHFLAPLKCTIEEQDPHRHADNLTNWTQEYDQLSDGRFYGRIDKSEQPQTHFFREYTSQSLRQQCKVFPDAVWFGFSDASKGCRINGLQAPENSLICRPGSVDFELVTPEDFTIYGIVLTQPIWQELALPLVADGDETLGDCSTIAIPEERLRQLVLLQERLLSAQAEQMDPRIKHDFILTALADGLQQGQAAINVMPSFQHRLRVVEKVKQYLSSHQDVPVTMTELCELTYVSRRTLQYSFETILGISPLKFLRASRLNHVHRALSHAQGDTCIADTAAKWGFWHAGQFSKDYKQLFGETPSETLKRR